MMDVQIDRAHVTVTPHTIELQIIEEGETTRTEYFKPTELNRVLDIVRNLGIHSIEIEDWGNSEVDDLDF